MVDSRREREYVRYVEVRALGEIVSPEREQEVIRVASQMRVNGEPRPKDWGLRRSLQGAGWSI